jgi:minor extracellular serine protease Vpr
MKKLVSSLLFLCSTVWPGQAQEPAKNSAIIQSTRIHPALREFSRTGALPRSVAQAKTGAETRDCDAVIYTPDADQLARAGIRIQSRYPGFVTAMLRPSDVALLEQNGSVSYSRPGLSFAPDNDLSRVETGSGLLHAGFVNATPYKGKGAIVLVYDTGIDWKHLDFRNPADSTKSRILFIWDQTLVAGPGESPPSGFTYGVEYTKAQIDNEIDGTPSGVVREKDIHGHGTHVAGTAAGNGTTFGKFAGQAPEADIIFVKGGDGSFSDVRMIDGLTYAANKAAALSKPIVVNWSLGSMWGPHDASDPNAVAIDAFCSQPGRVHVNSAGNSGNSLIHVEGTMSAAGSKSFSITVPAYTPKSGSFNDGVGMILWFNSTDTVTARLDVTSPTSKTYQLLAGETIFPDDADGRVQLGNMVSPDNRQRMFTLEVLDADSLKPPKAGTWTVTLTSVGKAVSYDGWLDPVSIGGQTITLTGSDVNKTVNSFVPNKSIMVGSYFTRYSWPNYDSSAGQFGRWTFNYNLGDRIGDISPFSSLGPSRDGRIKPDISSPGQYVLSVLSAHASASNSNVYPRLKYQVMQGTSMAAPNVTGCVALILGQSPSMTADQVKALLTSTAVTDGYTGSVPNNIFGAGKVNAFRAMTKILVPSATTAHTIFRYDKPGMSFNNSYMNFVVPINSSTKYALRFTPATGGTLAGVFCNLRWIVLPSGASLTCGVYTHVAGSTAGIPGTQIGTTIQIPLSSIDYCTTSYIDMLAAGVAVNAGTNYHVVLSLANAAVSDVVDLISDDGSANADNRTSVFTGGAWQNSGASGSGLSGKNIRVRPVVVTTNVTQAVETGQGGIPTAFRLSQNYPNPFNPSTTIQYALPLHSNVTLSLYNTLGQKVEDLVNEPQEAGYHEVRFEGTRLSSGVYFYRLQTGSFVNVKKLVVLR